MSRPVLEPREIASARVADAQASARSGVVVAAAVRPGPDKLVTARPETPTAFAFARHDTDPAAASPPEGVFVVEATPGSAPGRLLNAGYRHLKKMHPELRYVQFLEEDAALDPLWLETAVRFMERRPEVAVVAGADGVAAAAPDKNGAEVQSVGRSFLIRTDAFEAAGGFRGDLVVNETPDLCIRLRRRGAHVWLLPDRMATLAPRSGTWWSKAAEDGFVQAHGVRLHGGPPERLYVRELIVSVFWGAVLPAIIVTLAAALGALLLARSTWVSAVAAVVLVIAAGFAIYVARAAFVAFRRGPAARSSWIAGAEDTLGHFARVAGAGRFYLSGVDPRRAAS